MDRSKQQSPSGTFYTTPTHRQYTHARAQRHMHVNSSHTSLQTHIYLHIHTYAIFSTADEHTYFHAHAFTHLHTDPFLEFDYADEIAALLAEFLEVAITLVLSVRGIYPPGFKIIYFFVSWEKMMLHSCPGLKGLIARAVKRGCPYSYIHTRVCGCYEHLNAPREEKCVYLCVYACVMCLIICVCMCMHIYVYIYVCVCFICICVCT